MLPATNAPTCHCRAWQANLPKLEQLVILNWNRHGSGYTGDPFAYCPWCGRPLQDAASVTDKPQTDEIFQFKVTLRDSPYPVWRRFQIFGHDSFYYLHLTLQSVMGWLHSHLHLFEIDGWVIADETHFNELGDSGYIETRVMVAELLPTVGMRCSYQYDFGDDWWHDLVLEATVPVAVRRSYPFCLDGAGTCPPEDVGGIYGLQNFLDAMGDPYHDEYEEYLEWWGKPFDRAAFDVYEVNRRLQQGYDWHGYEVIPALAYKRRFTKPAHTKWLTLPAGKQKAILESCWCGDCQRQTRMVDYRGRIRRGALLLDGLCASCGSEISRVLEAN